MDPAATACLRENKFLLALGSFLSMPDAAGIAHLYLEGIDKQMQRERVWSQGAGRCDSCDKPLTWETFEWDHIQGGLVGRCDCLHNASVKCWECHHGKHVQVGQAKGEPQC